MDIKPSKRLELLPSYSFKEIIDKVEELKTKGITPIDFGIGDPSEPTPKFVIEAMKQLVPEHSTSGYPNYIGNKKFLTASVRYMKKRFNVDLDVDKEVCSNIGSKEAIFNFPEAFIDSGDVVICPSPGYPPMKTGTIFAEGEPYYVPLLEENKFLIDFLKIPKDICKKAKILWLNYPNSPTGAVADENYYVDLIKWARKNEIILAADEGCYIDIYFNEPPKSILQVAKENNLGNEGIVVFYSLSKRNNMTGYRVGFVAGDENIISLFKALKTNIDSGTPDFIQDVAAIALDDDEHIEYMRGLYKEKGEILLGALKLAGLEVKKPEATFYVWQKCPKNMNSIDFAKRLLEPDMGIVVTPGSIISNECEGGLNPGENYVRFALMPTLKEINIAAEKLRGLKF